MTARYIGNFFQGKWDSIIETLMIQEGEKRAFDQTFFKNLDGRFDNNIKMLVDAGYDKVDTVEWINYYPGKHFAQEVVTEFEKFSGVRCARAWISRLRPGKYAPIHQDIDDNIESYLSLGNLIRYSTFISQPHPGSVFVFADQAFHCIPSGDTYQWKDYKDYHAGGNCGLHDGFMFHFLGIVQ